MLIYIILIHEIKNIFARMENKVYISHEKLPLGVSYRI